VKPASVISLIVAVMLVIAGLVTCTIGKNMAESNGQKLLSENREEGKVNTVELGDMPVSKLEISVKDAAVNIYANCETTYVEFVNFRENYYSFSAANRVISFHEVPDIFSMLKFWENSFSFKGLRYLMDFNQEPAGEKVLNIYLGKDNTELKIVNISGEVCHLMMDGFSTAVEYTLEIANGSVTANSILALGILDLKGSDLTVSLNKSVYQQISIVCPKLDFSSSMLHANNCEIEFDTGSVNMIPLRAIEEQSYAISLESGSVVVNGTDMGLSFRQTPSTTSMCTINAKNASVTLQDRDNATTD